MEILPIIIDLILIWVLIGCILDGRKKGFVKMVLSLVATVISLFIAREFAEPVALWINENFVHDNIVESIAKAISSSLSSGANAVANALPDYIIRAGEMGGITAEGLVEGINTSGNVTQVAEQICSVAESIFIINAITVVAFFIIFAISNAVLGVLIGVVNSVAKLPVLKSLNKLLGGVLGFIKGGIAVYIVSAVFGTIAMLAPDNAFSQAVSETTLQQSFWEVIISMFN